MKFFYLRKTTDGWGSGINSCYFTYLGTGLLKCLYNANNNWDGYCSNNEQHNVFKIRLQCRHTANKITGQCETEYPPYTADGSKQYKPAKIHSNHPSHYRGKRANDRKK